ncbi:MAG: glycine--tRNA ligase subunit alpha [Candidatus Kappaea frigidicola]|nr:glycine--tRNA ligase subunit alpha [Candidatus Kappaea frigidicola]
MNFQDLISKLETYWKSKGCVIVYPYDIEVGAGTFHTATFLKCLDKNRWNTAFVQPSRRPTDGRYGDNPLRTQFYYQYQVILKPSPDNVKQLYQDSLEYIGINLKKHDFKFIEDDWSSPTLGAKGLGWEIWLDGLEITQFTYMQQMGGVELKDVACELTYGLERIAMVLQDKYDLFDLEWADGVTYGDLQKDREKESCAYNFEKADIDMYLNLFKLYEGEAAKLIDEGLIIPAYECTLKVSHIFNVLDARKAISQSERPTFIARVRRLANKCAQMYYEKNGK